MTEKLRAAHARIHAFAREHKPGGCRVLSSECTCPLCDADALLGAALASPNMEQRAGFVMVPVEPTEQMLTAASVTRARRDEANLYRHEVAAIYGAMLAAAPPIEALEGGKTDLGASGALGASNDNGAQA